MGGGGEIGIRSIDAQTTNPIVNMTKTIGLWLMYLPIAPFLSNNHPEMYCITLSIIYIMY